MKQNDQLEEIYKLMLDKQVGCVFHSAINLFRTFYGVEPIPQEAVDFILADIQNNQRTSVESITGLYEKLLPLMNMHIYSIQLLPSVYWNFDENINPNLKRYSDNGNNPDSENMIDGNIIIMRHKDTPGFAHAMSDWNPYGDDFEFFNTGGTLEYNTMIAKSYEPIFKIGIRKINKQEN